jgi:murein DD-endopeptidase MepM/ murein hydrolase activator NlpD
MYLRVCVWLLSALTLWILVYVFVAEPEAPAHEPVRALLLPRDFELKAVLAAEKAKAEAEAEKLKSAREALPPSARAAADVLRVIPAAGPISSEYGSRVLISFSRPRMHSGVDIKARRGSPVKAAGPGIVSFSGRNGTYGLMVKIDHGDDVSTWYAHMDKSLVKVDEPVEAGQQIGIVGRTGKTTGANLHFEIRVNGASIDPRLVFYWPPSPPRKPKPQLP